MILRCDNSRVIVRGADTDRLDLAPQCAGLLALSLGLSKNFADDHAMLQPRHGDVRRAVRVGEECSG